VNFPNPRHLRAFIVLAETRSFSTASGRLHISQSALSQAVSKLEEICGISLVERTTRSVRLTAAGEEFLVDAKRVIEQNERLLTHGQERSRGDRGSLTLLTIPSVAQRLLSTLIVEFYRCHQGVDIIIHDHPDPVLRQKMTLGEGDLGLITESAALEAALFLPLLRDSFRVVLPASHRLASHAEISAGQLATERLILPRRGTLLRAYVDSTLSRLRLRHDPIEISQVATVIGMVESGLGVSVLPGLACPSPSLLSVVSRPLQRPSIARVIGFVRPADRLTVPAAQSFARVAIDYLGHHPESLPDGVRLLHNSSARVADFLA
jgi:LysR family carnitine catabolism transcriptional activator